MAPPAASPAPGRPSDPDLIDRAFTRYQKTEEPAALAEVFDATAAELLRVAVHLVQDMHVAEDLVQATFLTAIQHRRDYQPGTRVIPWLMAILTNMARRHHRLQKQLPVYDTAPGDSSAGEEQAAQGRRVGLGYLELTGYAAPLRM